jgi:hypothetical protein
VSRVRPFWVVSSPIRMIWLVRGQGGSVAMTLKRACNSGGDHPTDYC